MLKHVHMTEKARLVFNSVTDVPATAGEVSQDAKLTDSCCQLILTQLVMAGLIKENIKERTYQSIQL
ncbi:MULTISPECIES: TrmB family transcriptional regulator [unclassified Providencia]|uniref:TrmB family transcriptional regulator n=1 Tax=unclassified Providencia TaxID=2633465 RepID=UPI0023491248|nr:MULTISPECIES: TrmB family transcriptional regulator [unclassified Providencia]